MSDDEYERLEALGARLDGISKTIAAETKAREKDTEARNKSENATRSAITWTRVICGLLGLMIFVMATFVYTTNNEAATASDSAKQSAQVLQQFLEQRTASRRVQCRDQKAAAESVNALNAKDQALLTTIANSPNTSPEGKTFLEDQIAKYQALTLQVRDCSSQEAIDAYWAQQG